MSRSSSLAQRILEDELMDDPSLRADRHIKALRGLSRLNAMSGAVGAVWRPIRKLARALQVDSLRILDLGTGSGDIPIGLWKRAKRHGLHWEILGVDMSERSVEQARDRAKQAGAQATFQQLNILENALPTGYDVVVCSLLIHHLTTPDAVRLLRVMRQAAKHLIVVNDLVRSRLNLWLVTLGSQLLSRSDVVHTDGPLSVRAAFTVPEMRSLADEAGLQGANVRGRFPCRLLLTWETS